MEVFYIEVLIFNFGELLSLSEVLWALTSGYATNEFLLPGIYSDFFILSVFVKCLIIAGVQENLNGLGGDFDFVF